MDVREVNEEGQPLDNKTLTRLKRVCSLVARQKVNINLESFEKLQNKDSIFNNHIQRYVIFPENLKEKAQKLCMKMISSRWRDYKSHLIKIMRNGEEPFGRYKHLSREDWNSFVARCSTEDFQARSVKMSELRSKNKANHHLGPAGYIGKKDVWEKEDEQYAREVRRNPWHKYPGHCQSYIRARSKATDSGSVTYTSSNIEEVAKIVLAAISDGSHTGSRENDTLSLV